MSYKTVLVHVDDSKHVKARIEIAAKIAMSQEAHLIGAASTGISQFIHDTVTVNPKSPTMAPYLETLRQRADVALNTFETVARTTGLTSLEKRLIDDEAAGGISLQARYCDLVVVGQDDPNELSATLTSNFPEYVVMNGASPTLIIPYEGDFKTIGDRVLIAWNASTEAMHAVRGALPLLKRAKTVEVVVFNPASRSEIYGEEPGADVALYLARHNVKVDVMQQEVSSEVNVGNALLSLAGNLGSDLLVMGCYGHSRFRETLLGGATRSILESMTIPVLMAH